MSSSESNFFGSYLVGVPSSLSLIDTIDADSESVLSLNYNEMFSTTIQKKTSKKIKIFTISVLIQSFFFDKLEDDEV